MSKQTEWRQRNLDKVRQYDRERRKKDRRKINLMYYFGLTLEQYDEMLIAQDFRCWICQRHISELKKQLAVDHCHETKKIRGLLCTSCNTGLGCFKDNKELLTKAKEYLDHD